MIIYLSDFSGFTALQCPMHLGVLNKKKIKVFTYVNVYVSHCSDKKIKGQSVFYRLSTVFAVKRKFGF